MKGEKKKEKNAAVAKICPTYAYVITTIYGCWLSDGDSLPFPSATKTGGPLQMGARYGGGGRSIVFWHSRRTLRPILLRSSAVLHTPPPRLSDLQSSTARDRVGCRSTRQGDAHFGRRLDSYHARSLKKFNGAPCITQHTGHVPCRRFLQNPKHSPTRLTSPVGQSPPHP